MTKPVDTPLPTSWLADWSNSELLAHVDACRREIEHQQLIAQEEGHGSERRRAASRSIKNLSQRTARYRTELRRRVGR
jgi:hypothetical protein